MLQRLLILCVSEAVAPRCCVLLRMQQRIVAWANTTVSCTDNTKSYVRCIPLSSEHSHMNDLPCAIDNLLSLRVPCMPSQPSDVAVKYAASTVTYSCTLYLCNALRDCC